MHITLKLFALLTDYLPPGSEHNSVSLELPDNVRIGQLIEQLCLPRELVHLVMLNGVYVAPQQRFEQSLRDNDVLAIWPPVAGG